MYWDFFLLFEILIGHLQLYFTFTSTTNQSFGEGTLTFKKIRTLCVLEDKFKVEQNWIQNRCKLLLDVRKGSYEHALMFTRPMSLQNFVEHSYIICSVQGGQDTPVQFCLGMIWELAFTYLYCLILSFKMQKMKSLNIN